MQQADLNSQLSSEFCDSLDDIPPLDALFIESPVYLILPPYNWDWISQAHQAANWKWFMELKDRLEFWKDRPKTDAMNDYLEENRNGVIPSPERIQRSVERGFNELRRCPSDGATISGGHMTFVSKSGRLGLILDATLGEHYARIKLASVHLCAAEKPSNLSIEVS